MAFVDFFRSKLLAVAGIVLFLTCLATILAAFSPFWYVMSIDYRHGTDQYSGLRTINVGLFFMDESRFTSMVMLEKSSNQFFLPAMLHISQLFYLLGTTGVVVCCAAAFILSFRSYTSVTGEICLAAATTSIVLSLVIGVVLAALSPMNENIWKRLPVPDPVPDRYVDFFLNTAEPTTMVYNWGFFVAALATGIGIVAAILMWIQAIKTCITVKDFRYRSLHSRHPDDEPAAAPVYMHSHTRGAPQYGKQEYQGGRIPPSKLELDL